MATTCFRLYGLLPIVVLTQVAAAPRAFEAAQSRDSLTLADALHLARAESPALDAARAAVRQAEAGRSVARAARLPTAGVEALYLRYQDPPSLDFGAQIPPYTPLATNNYVVRAGLTQTLFTFGRIGAGVRAADWSAQSAESSRAAAEVEVTAAVARAHDDVLLARALRDVAAQGVAVLTEAVRVAQERYAAGTTARLDAIRAETRLSSARAALRAQETALATAREHLAMLIGIAVAGMPPVSGALEDVEEPIPDERLLERAGAGRPDITALQQAATALRARASAERATQLPRIGAFVSVLGTRPELLTGASAFEVDVLGGVYVAWPFFDGGASRGTAQRSEAAALGIEAEARATADRAGAAVHTALLNAQRAAADVRDGTENVKRAERALAIAQERYSDGIGIQLDVLEAEADLTQARGDLLRAMHARRAAAIELRRAVGLPADAPLPSSGGNQ